MLVTVFTPIYNRERSIKAVYDSLCAQTSYNFEWLVLNDGSTDRSGEILEDIIAHHESGFEIRYVVKENEGLSRTINKAIDMAKGELLMRLDSDDVALPNAIELIEQKYPLVKDKTGVCAVAFLSELFDGSINGYHPFFEDREETIVDYRHIYHGTGDRNEVMKVDVYRNFKYPEFEGEKFCSEGVVWDRIAKNYRFLYVPEAIYRKGFDDDSITSKIYQTLKKNCKGTTLLYYEIIRDFPYLPFSERLLFAIKYYRYAFFAHAPLFRGIPLPLVVCGLPLGLLVIIYDRFKYPEAFNSQK